MAQNKAAWCRQKGDPLTIDDAEYTTPEKGQVLIKNRAIAINPVDVAQLNAGMFVSAYPAIFGNDVAGEVVDVGPDVSHISKGQRLMANSVSIMTGKPADGAFQLYTIVQANGCCAIPDSVSFEQAVVAPLAISTAAAGLYEPDQLALPYPSLEPKKTGKALIVWSGASSVGAQAIQLGVASGLEVYATASKKNFEYCKSLGATDVFDYSRSSVVEDIVGALKGKEVAGAYDAIALEQSVKALGQILSELGGGRIACTLPNASTLPDGVSLGSVFGPSVVGPYPDVGTAVYVDYLPQAFAQGKYKLAPEPKVVGKGLESIEEAIGLYAKGGISAAKLVVTL